MPRNRPPYPAEFRARMVELVRSGRTPEDLSREFEPTAQSIWNWVRQAERDEGIHRGQAEAFHGAPFQVREDATLSDPRGRRAAEAHWRGTQVGDGRRSDS